MHTAYHCISVYNIQDTLVDAVENAEVALLIYSLIQSHYLSAERPRTKVFHCLT